MKKATPLQRYALRLLFSARNGSAVSYESWTALQQDEAERMMSPFGGLDKIMREMQLPRKRDTQKTERSRTAASKAPERAGRFRKNEIEFGE